MRALGIVSAVLAVLLGSAAFYVYQQVHTLTVRQITEDLHVIYGLGGNVGVLRTGEGSVIVDTMTLHSQGTAIMKEAEALTGEPVVMIVNTHYHLDHTHGNPAFPEGTRVVSTNRTRHHLEVTDSDYFSDTPGLMPNETFDDRRRISIGNKHLTFFHPGSGHTDGDLVVLFEEDRTVHMGDLHFNNHYPNIDLEAGGSVQKWPQSLDKVFSTLSFDHVIPGHGEVTDQKGLREYQAFVSQLGSLAREAKKSGTSVEQFLKSEALTEDAGYEPIKMIIPIGLDREFVLRRAWEEVHDAFELRE